jgi:hypothetical protein
MLCIPDSNWTLRIWSTNQGPPHTCHSNQDNNHTSEWQQTLHDHGSQSLFQATRNPAGTTHNPKRVGQVEKAFLSDTRTTHELRILRKISELVAASDISPEPRYWVESSRRATFVSRNHQIYSSREGALWEKEDSHHINLNSSSLPEFIGKFKSIKHSYSGKPIRNPQAYAAAVARNQGL